MTGATPTVEPSASDIPKGGWMDRFVPAPVRPYLRLARLDRPIGTWLLLFPCWWGIALASNGLPSLWLMVLFGIGAVVMRGAGCTYNDIVDRDFDARVARTADRPIPSGAVTVKQAIAFLVLQALLGLAILLQLSPTAIGLGVLSLVLVFIYPLMKRVTWWPQFFLGLAFNWGALMGPAAVLDTLPNWAFVLYAGGIFWTLGYDTIYAHQDKEDDALIGVKSSARLLGARTRPALCVFYGGAIVLFGIAGQMASLSWPFRTGLILGAAQLAWQVTAIDIDDPADCLRMFKANRVFGWIVLAAIVLGHLL
ncbi:MAG: 4-hydroxybenzoate octaprenyltransferase [Alphaproteobacteria bacterium]|nr:4-hydroxybenzoate octaprenyltransferase [Alphaproteobacteria bacterium]